MEFSIDRIKYKIECPKDEEKKITSLASIVDKKAKKLRSHLKNIDDKTLLAILCLTIQEEVKARDSSSSKEDISLSEAVTREAIENITKVSDKIESLAKKIERC